MKKIIMLFVLALACVGVRSQTLLSRSYDVSPVISYTVFEPQKRHGVLLADKQC